MTRAHRAHSLRRRISLFLHRWHRRIGVLASLFVIWMVVSGWLLNHTAALDLAQRVIHSPVLAQRYGLHAELPASAFNAQAHWLVQTPDAWLLDGEKSDAITAQPIGMVFHNDILFVSDRTQLLLLAADGTAIDKLTGSSLPITHMEKIGSGCDGAVITDDAKNFVTRDGVAWSECTEAVAWSAAQPLTEQQKKRIAPLLEPGISAERLLQDLHSGRILGTWGPYFIDAVGLGLLLLALSGLWMFAFQRRAQRAARR
jgi:hypothetical protein